MGWGEREAHPEEIGEDGGVEGGPVAANLKLEPSAAGGKSVELASLRGVLGLNWLGGLMESSTLETRDMKAQLQGLSGHADNGRRRGGCFGSSRISREGRGRRVQRGKEWPGAFQASTGRSRWPGKQPGGGAVAGMLATPTSCLPGLGWKTTLPLVGWAGFWLGWAR